MPVRPLWTSRPATAAVLLLLILTMAVQAAAQITTGTVNGAVKDDQGLRVPGATVVLISEARGTRLASVVTNTNGDFVIPNVTADTYTVEVTMPGFKTLRRPGVAVSGGDRVGVGELVIGVGGASETVTVTDEAPLLQSQSGERSFRVTTNEVENLPLSNRNFASLTTLTPGVSGTTRLGGGGQNNFMIDGASAMDTGNNGQVLQLNVDAIAEVKVLTAGYQAEFGRSSGLQITAVTKSGTNAFHGSVYDIQRNSDWNSNSWANAINGTPKTEDKQTDWGYSIGGPVGRPGGTNKLFFFYSHEVRPRTTANVLRQFRVPTLAERNGDFSQSLDNVGVAIPALRDATGATIPGNVIPASQLYQPGLAILRRWPEPNMTQQQGTGYNYEFLSPRFKSSTQQPAFRADYQVSPSLRITGKFAGQRGFKGTTPGTIPGFNDTYNAYPWVKTWTTTVNYTLTPTTFLEATYGFANRRLGQIVNSPLTNRFDAGLGGLPYIYPDANIVPAGSYNRRVMEEVAPPFYVNGRAELAPTFLWGNRVANTPPNLAFPGFLNTNPVHDVSLSLTRVAGRHTLKAGFYNNRSQKAQNLNQRNALPFQGEIDFGNNTNNPIDSGFGFANAALGIFSSYTQQGNFVEGNFVYRNIEGYLQDNWKVTNRLTFDYGARFVHQQPQYDSNLQASNFFIDRYSRAAAPALYTAGCVNGANPCSGTNRRAFNPVTNQLLGPGTNVLIGQIVPNSGNLTNGIVVAGQGISKYNYEWPVLSIAPRLGFAYDVTGAQRFVVRGGGGLFFDRPDGDSIYYQSQNPPTSSSTIVRYGTLQTLGTGGVASQGVPTIINYRYDNTGLPSSVQWNTGVQITLPWASALDVSYVGQHSYNVLNAFQSNTAVNINAIDFGTAFLPQYQDPTLVQGVAGSAAVSTELMRPIFGYGNIDQQWQSFERTYHSLQASYTRRFRNGFSGGLNYTLSISDEGTTGVPLRLQHNADGSYFIRDDQGAFNELMKNQGLQRHLVKGNFVWDLPDVTGGSGALKVVGAVVNDWQLSGVLTAGSGGRYDISYQYQNNGANVNLTGSPDYAARAVINGDTGSGCSEDRFQQFNTSAFSGPLPGSVGLESGRNYMVGCADTTWDLAIARNFRMGASRRFQVRAEMFNAFNAVVINGRITQLQLVSPTNQTVRNPQYLSDGTVDPNKIRTTSAGFGAATTAQAMRSVQVQARFSF